MIDGVNNRNYLSLKISPLTGRQFIMVKVKVFNKNAKKEYSYKVSFNKNYGIYDIQPRVGEVLSDFQGRQLVYSDGRGGLYINDTVISELETAIYNTLNA